MTVRVLVVCCALKLYEGAGSAEDRGDWLSVHFPGSDCA